MITLVVTFLLAFVTGNVNCFSGMFYGFDGYPDGNYRHYNHRIRSCPKGSTESCLNCECYGSSCGIGREQRILSKYYSGLFSNDRLKYIKRKIKRLHGSKYESYYQKQYGPELFTNLDKTNCSSTTTTEVPITTSPVSSTEKASRPIIDDCCKTVLTITLPIDNTVIHNGAVRTLVTVESSQNLPFHLQSNQYRVEGVCQSPTSSCGELNRGVCRQEYGITEVLVHDDIDPSSFEFIPIHTRMYCRCVFPGELLTPLPLDTNNNH